MAFEMFKQVDYRNQKGELQKEFADMFSQLTNQGGGYAVIDKPQYTVDGYARKLGYKVHTAKLETNKTIVWLV